MARTPIIRVKYTLDVGSGVPTLQEIVRFAEMLEEMGESRFLKGALQGTMHDGVYVSGVIQEKAVDPNVDLEVERLRAKVARIYDLMIAQAESKIGWQACRQQVFEEIGAPWVVGPDAAQQDPEGD